jgi:hypothetical protein
MRTHSFWSHPEGRRQPHGERSSTRGERDRRLRQLALSPTGDGSGLAIGSEHGPDPRVDTLTALDQKPSNCALEPKAAGLGY